MLPSPGDHGIKKDNINTEEIARPEQRLLDSSPGRLEVSPMITQQLPGIDGRDQRETMRHTGKPRGSMKPVPQPRRARAT